MTQIVQHNAFAIVNKGRLCLFPPNLHHRLNKSCVLIGLGIPNNKWTALHKKLAYAQSKKGVEQIYFPIPITFN